MVINKIIKSFFVVILISFCSIAFAQKTIEFDGPSPSWGLAKQLNTPYKGDTVWVLDVSELPLTERFAATCLQGLANRNLPNIFLQTVDAHWVSTFKHRMMDHSEEIQNRYRSTDDAWIDWYMQRYGLKFVELGSLEQLYAKNKAFVKGVILYSGQGDSFPAAATIASVEDCLPVTAEMIEKYPLLKLLPVVVDITAISDDRTELYSWLLENYIPKTNSKTILSTIKSSDVFDVDIAIANRATTYCLDYTPGNDKQRELIGNILGHLEPNSTVLGWGKGGESNIVNLLSEHGHYLVCTDIPNLSFHKAIKTKKIPQSRKNKISKNLKLEDKYYICFVVNEGDTLKALAGMMCYGMWMLPERGNVPVGWGTSTWILENYPSIRDFYFTTAKPTDDFVSIIGYGYYNPNENKQFLSLAQREADIANRYGITAGSMWHVNDMSKDSFDKWLDARGCEDYIWESSNGFGTYFSPEGHSVTGTDWKLFYSFHRFKNIPGTNEEKTAKFIKEAMAENKPPFFMPIYAGDPHYFGGIMENLKDVSDKIEFVSISDFVRLSKMTNKISIDTDRLEIPKSSEVVFELELHNYTLQNVDYDVIIACPSGLSVSKSAIKAKLWPGKSKKIKFGVTAENNLPEGTFEINLTDSENNIDQTLYIDNYNTLELIPTDQAVYIEKLTENKKEFGFKDIKPTEGFTVSLWLKDIGNKKWFTPILHQFNTNNQSRWGFGYINGYRLGIFLRSEDGKDLKVVAPRNTGLDGEFHNWTAVIGADKVQLWLDGMLVSETNITDGQYSCNTHLETYRPNKDNTKAHEIRIFERTLSPAEIKTIYRKQKSGY
jgi:hypothetical protein